MYDIYDLSKRIHGKAPTRAVEIGEVTKTEPLTVKIGDGTYEAGSRDDQWTFYEAWFEDRDGEFTKPGKWKNGTHTGASVNCSEGSISQMTYTEDTWQSGEYEERKAYMKYNVGDKLAVQQMEGDNVFIILCKIREVE